MDKVTPKTFTTSRSLTYSYYHIPSASANSTKPTLLFCHGFPDGAHLWSAVIPPLLSLGHPMIVPDLLGYGGTSKPTDPALYNSKSMTADIAELLAAENITAVIPIGHDWGSFFAQRFYLWHPKNVVGLILLNVAYLVPDQTNRFDLAAVNEATTKLVGYPIYDYWHLFTAPDGPELLNSRLESFWAVLHGASRGWMKDMFCVPGAMRAFVEADKRVPLAPYGEDPHWRDEFMQRFKRDGLQAPLQWYVANTLNHNFDVEKEIPPERLTINVPVLFVGCTGDAVCLSAFINEPQQKGLLPKLTVEEIESAHWSPMEKPGEIAEHLAAFLKETF